MNPYYTHREYLQQELERLKDGSVVLELGVGDGSSEVMGKFAKLHPNIKIYGLEPDVNWLYNTKMKYAQGLDNYKCITRS